MILEYIQKWARKSIIGEIIIFALLVSFVETSAQSYLIKSDNSSTSFVIGVILYTLVATILNFSYKHYPISKLNTIWSCISILSATTIGTILYKEPFTRNKFLSLLFALFSIIFAY